MNARVKRSGALHEERTAQKQTFIVSGKIRPGVKVPTHAAAKHPAMVDAYQQGVAAGASYDDITRMMKAAEPGFKSNYPLVPRNSPSFRVMQADFAIPGAVNTLIDLYGEKRGTDKEKQLYTFPIVFPSADIDSIFTEQFEAWSRSQILHWSDNGNCMKIQDVKPDKSKRKRWGPRDHEVVGPCDPNECDLFGKGECKHMGSLFFWIPGLTGVGVIQLDFTSIYASMGIMEMLETVQKGLKSIPGVDLDINGMLKGKPIFQISKQLRDVSMMDWETGKPKKQQQQIIQLEAPGLDMCKLLEEQATKKLAGPEEVKQIEVTDADKTLLDAITEAEIESAEGVTKINPEDDTTVEAVTVGPTAEEIAEAEKTKQLVAQLRGVLADEMRRLGTDGDGLVEWMKHNKYTADDTHDPDRLQAMIEDMKKLVVETAEEDDEEIPF